MSFYGSKMVLDHPHHFSQVPIVFDGSNLFWLGSNHVGQVQIIRISPEKSKWFGPNQDDLDPTKTIWTQPKQFVPTKRDF